MDSVTAEAPLETALGNFMEITAKSTVAVIIPLFGEVNGEVLAAALRRVYSNVHHLYFVFVAFPQGIAHDEKDPTSIGNIIMSKMSGRNVLNVSVGPNASYAEYIEEGLHASLNDTNASFVVVLNPWVMIQEGAMDVLIDRANYGDDAKIISGFDIRTVVEPEGFDQFKTTMPKEEWDLSFNFLGMPRYVAEMLALDPNFKTHKFLERDFWQQIVSKGFAVISSQRIPIFPFDFPWTSFESKEDFQSDDSYFQEKWHFNPGFQYNDEK